MRQVLEFYGRRNPNSRRERLEVRITAKQKNRLLAICEQHKTKSSDYIRFCVDNAEKIISDCWLDDSSDRLKDDSTTHAACSMHTGVD